MPLFEKKSEWTAWLLGALLILFTTLGTWGLVGFYPAAPYYFVAGILASMVLILRPVVQYSAIEHRQPVLWGVLRSVKNWDKFFVGVGYMAFVFSALNGFSGAKNAFPYSLPVAIAASALFTVIFVQTIQAPLKAAALSGHWSEEDRHFSRRILDGKILVLPIAFLGAMAATLQRGGGPVRVGPFSLALMYVALVSFTFALLLFRPSRLEAIRPSVRYGVLSAVMLLIVLPGLDTDWLSRNWLDWAVSGCGFLSLVAVMSRVWEEIYRHRKHEAASR